MSEAVTHTSRKPTAVKRAIALLFGQGKSKSYIARTLSIDRETVSRVLADPETQALRTEAKASAQPATAAAGPQAATKPEWLVRSEHRQKRGCPDNCNCAELLADLGRTREEDDAIRAARHPLQQVDHAMEERHIQQANAEYYKRLALEERSSERRPIALRFPVPLGALSIP